MGWNLNGEQWKRVGKGTLKVLTKIGIEGTKAVVLNTLSSTVKTGFEEGVDGIKTLTLDDYLNGGRKKSKMKIFSKKPAAVLEVEAEEIEFEEIEELEETEEILDYEIIEPEPVKNPNF